MEEKLNMIFEKMLDIECAFKEIQYEKRKKELEYEKKEIEYKIDDLKYIKEKELEYKAEMMSIFRNISTQKQTEEDIKE